MITKLSLRNFKTFHNLDKLKIKPITILSGKNSIGKSSILQSLLLLKQSLTNEHPGEALSLEGDFLQYPHLRELAYGLPKDKNANIFYSFELEEGSSELGELSFEIRHKQLPNDKERKGTVVTKFSWKGTKDQKVSNLFLTKGEYILPSNAKIKKFPPPKGYKFHSKQKVRFENFLPNIVLQAILPLETDLNKEASEKKIERIGFPIFLLESSLSELCSNFERDLRRIRYLGPSRAIPRRAYIQYTEKHYELDSDGGNAAQVYWLRQNENINFLGKSMKLKKGVEECLKMIGFNQRVIPSRSSKIVYQLLVENSYDTTKKVTIADVGFGYSQVLPIILLGLLSEKNALLLFEQPEIHLHPSSKAKLADIFIAFSKSDKRLIIETHSTELINCIQLRVIQDPTLRETINVSFIEEPKEDTIEGAQIRQLALREDGMFDQWPEGFCDETEQLSRKIIKANIKRMK